MRVIAYGRRAVGAPSVTEQIERAEGWTRGQRHEVRRLVRYPLYEGLSEYPPMAGILKACLQQEVDAVVLTDVEVLGERLVSTLRELSVLDVGVLLVGDGREPLHLRRAELKLLLRVAKIVKASLASRASRPPRVCPPKVHVDLDLVERKRSAGARLEDIAAELGVARSTLVRKLRRARREAG